MRSLFLTAAALALAASPALAATSTATAAGPEMNQSGTSSESAQTSGQHNAALQQKIHQELSQAGFTDIQVAPESFLVHAKDSSGNPVVMAITPNSVTAVTAMSGQPGSASGSQATQNGGTAPMGSSPMTNSAHAGSAGNGTGGTVR